MTPLLLTLFIGITNTGNIMGVIGYIIVEALFMWTIYWQSYKLGYEKGSDAIVTIMESGLINQLILAHPLWGCLVLGGLVGNYVTLGLKLMVPVGGGVMFNIQEQLFDVILPEQLPLLLTLGTYKLVKKGWSSVNISSWLRWLVWQADFRNLCIIVRGNMTQEYKSFRRKNSGSTMKKLQAEMEKQDIDMLMPPLLKIYIIPPATAPGIHPAFSGRYMCWCPGRGSGYYTENTEKTTVQYTSWTRRIYCWGTASRNLGPLEGEEPISIIDRIIKEIQPDTGTIGLRQETACSTSGPWSC